MTVPSLYERDGDRYRPHDHARGPWSADALHGGPITGLMVHAVEHHVPDAEHFVIVRLLADLTRPVPNRPLTVHAEITHPGRRLQRVAVSITCDDVEVSRAAVIRRRLPTGPITPEELPGAMRGAYPMPRFPESTDPTPPFAAAQWTAFHYEALEYRYVDGTPADPGPATIWARMKGDLVQGTPVSPVVRAATISDMGFGFAWDMTSTGIAMINADVNLNFARPPLGEWIGVAGHSVVSDLEIGWTDTALFDRSGTFASVSQTLVGSTSAPWINDHQGAAVRR
jgi:acyl-CoA thioesterase